MKGRYLDIVHDCMDKLVSTGLYSSIDQLYFCTLGDISQLSQVTPLLGEKAKHVAHDDNMGRYERWTLEHLWQKAHESTTPFYALYLHSKGISRPESKAQPWRHLMLHYLSQYWPLAISFLEQGWGSVGSNLHHWPSTHYSGNFWWVRSEAIQSLSLPIGPAYLDPEMWIGNISQKFPMATFYQHPQWRCLNTMFHKFPYQNEFHQDHLKLYSSNLSFSWHQIPTISYFGLHPHIKTVEKKDLENSLVSKHKHTSTITCTIHLALLLGDRSVDPLVGVTKYWVFRGVHNGQLYTLLEGTNVVITDIPSS